MHQAIIWKAAYTICKYNFTKWFNFFTAYLQPTYLCHLQFARDDLQTYSFTRQLVCSKTTLQMLLPLT